ncbi:hypothetical protein [Geobacillus sp. BK01]|uniref:hypothetical protein n=1 Tax=Geobacillus sp. BK01 TaxID=3457328 RepID=UPI003FA52DD3
MGKEAVIYVVAFVLALGAVWLLPLGFSRVGGAVAVMVALLAAVLAKLAESVAPVWQTVLLVGLLLAAASYLLDRRFGAVLYRMTERNETGRRGTPKGAEATSLAGQAVDGGRPSARWPEMKMLPREEDVRQPIHAGQPDGNAPAHDGVGDGPPALDEIALASEEAGETAPAFAPDVLRALEEGADRHFTAPFSASADGAEEDDFLLLGRAAMADDGRDGSETEEEKRFLSELSLLPLEDAASEIEPVRRLDDWLDELPVAVTPDIEAAVLQTGKAADSLDDGGQGLRDGAGVLPPEWAGLERTGAFIDRDGFALEREPSFERPPFAELPKSIELRPLDIGGAMEAAGMEAGEGAALEPPREERREYSGLDNGEEALPKGREEGEGCGADEGEQKAEGETQAAGPPGEERKTVRPEVVQAVALELRLSRRCLAADSYERCLRRCLEAPLSDRDYYVLARLLMEHYVLEQQYDKLAIWLDELAGRFGAYPAVAEELALWRQQAAALANKLG